MARTLAKVSVTDFVVDVAVETRDRVIWLARENTATNRVTRLQDVCTYCSGEAGAPPRGKLDLCRRLRAALAPR